MQKEYWANPAMAVVLLLGCVGSAVAEPLTLPKWEELFTRSGDVRDRMSSRSGDRVPVFVGERFSGGRALERTVLVRSGRSALADRDRAVQGRVASAFDLGNVYAMRESSQDGDLHVYIASEHIFDSATDSVIEFSLYRAQHRLRSENSTARVLGHDVAGDLRIKVLVRDGTPRGLAIQRRAGGKWRRIMRARFGSSGCAGSRQSALVCVKTLASGGPVASPKRGRDAAGALVPLPSASSMLELGVNLGALVNANADVASIAVRTERDIVLGQLSRRPARSVGGGS